MSPHAHFYISPMPHTTAVAVTFTLSSYPSLKTHSAGVGGGREEGKGKRRTLSVRISPRRRFLVHYVHCGGGGGGGGPRKTMPALKKMYICALRRKSTRFFSFCENSVSVKTVSRIIFHREIFLPPPPRPKSVWTHPPSSPLPLLEKEGEGDMGMGGEREGR